MNSLFLSIPIYLQDPFIASFSLAFLLLFIFLNRSRRRTYVATSNMATIQSIGTHVPEHIASADYFLKVVSYLNNKHSILINSF